MLLFCDPRMFLDVTRARTSVLRSLGRLGAKNELVAKSAGPAHLVDHIHPDWQWIMGVSTTEYNGGRTLVVRVDGALGYGSDAGWEFGARTELVAKSIAAAAEKRRLALATNVPGPERVVLDLNTPGGMVAGWSDMVGAVRACKAAGIKIDALVHDMACSGGMMLALLCDRVLITGTAMVGSLGVLFEHYDVHRMLDEDGISIEPIVSDGSEKKRESASYAPLSDEARMHLKARANDIAAQIVADIADVGGRIAADVRAIFDGRVYEARSAMAWANAGGRMIDGIVDPQAFFDALGRGEEPALRSEFEPADDAGVETDTPEQETPVSEANKNNAPATAAQIEAIMGGNYNAEVAMGYLKQNLSETAVATAENARSAKLLTEAKGKVVELGGKVATLEKSLAEATAKLDEQGKQIAAITADNAQAKATFEKIGGKVPALHAPHASNAGGKAAGGVDLVAGATGYETAVAEMVAAKKIPEAQARYLVERQRPDLWNEHRKAKSGG